MQQVYLSLEIEGTDAPVRIYQYEGYEAISQPYRWELLVDCGVSLSSDELVGCVARLRISKDGALVRTIAGIVASCVDLLDSQSEEWRYRLTLAPRMWKSQLVTNFDILIDQSVPEVVRRRLSMLGLSDQSDMAFRLNQRYESREFIVQYQESDLSFVSRLLEHLGIHYFFEEHDDKDVIVFGDDNHSFPPLSPSPRLIFAARGEQNGIRELSKKTTMTPRNVIERDYNYRNPGIDLTAIERVHSGHAGGIYEYGSHFKTPEEAEQIARVRAEELATQRDVYEGRSNLSNLSAGVVIELDHPRGAMSLLLTSVTHRGEQGWATGEEEVRLHYSNQFNAISSSHPFRPPRKIPKPRIDGLLNGIIEGGPDGLYADVDELGRYRVRFLFDVADGDERPASRLVRMMQPHSGPGYGMHFPLRKGTEVMIGFVGGDPDRPVIMGSVPNAVTASPVTNTNAQRNIIRTGGNNEINIDDTDGKQRIKFTVPHADTVFQLGSPNFPESGAALSTRGAHTSLATSGISSAGTFASAFSSLVSFLLSSAVVTEAGKPTLLELTPSGIEAYSAMCDIAHAAITAQREALLLEEAKAAEVAHDAAVAATKSQQACRSCRQAATKSLPTTAQPPAKRIAELKQKPAASLTSAEANELEALEALEAYDTVCDEDDDTYLTTIGTMEDRNGIIQAAREGTNPDFDPVMDRDAWAEVANYDYELFVSLRTHHDNQRWDGTATTAADRLTDEDRAAWNNDKAAWLANERARWDVAPPADPAAEGVAFDGLTEIEQAAQIVDKPAGWDSWTDAQKQAHWQTLSSEQKERAKLGWIAARRAASLATFKAENETKTKRANAKAELIAKLDAAGGPYSAYKQELVACEAEAGACGGLDAKRLDALRKNTEYARCMRGHGEDLRKLRKMQLDVEAAKLGGEAAGGLFSVISQIYALVRRGGARRALNSRWAAAQTRFTDAPGLKTAGAQATIAVEDVFATAYGGLQGLGARLNPSFFMNPAKWNYLHHLGSENDTSVDAVNTLSLTGETAMLLGVGQDALGNYDPAAGNVLIGAGEGVRIASAGETEMIAGERAGISSAGRIEIAITNADNSERPQSGAVFRQGQANLTTSEWNNAGRHELSSLELDHQHASLVARSGPVSTISLARVASENDAGATMASLELREDGSTDLLSGATFGLRVTNADAKLTDGPAGWGMRTRLNRVQLGTTPDAAPGLGIDVQPNDTRLTGGQRAHIVAGTINLTGNQINFGAAAIQADNLYVKAGGPAPEIAALTGQVQAAQAAADAAQNAADQAQALADRNRAQHDSWLPYPFT